MLLRLDPVRLLIADDVGVGKTVEAAMIASEMLGRGVVGRIRVLCALPPVQTVGEGQGPAQKMLD